MRSERPRPEDPLAAAILLAASFDEHQVDYAIGGALAYSLWGIPRATIDVVINVFTEPDALGPVFDALTDLGIEVNRDQAKAASAFSPCRQTAWIPPTSVATLST